MRNSYCCLIAIWVFLLSQCRAIAQEINAKNASDIVCGDEQLNRYLPLLEGKRVALLINNSARVGETLMVDTLIRKNINIVKIFVPEHGLRGQADAGAKVNNSIDSATGLPVISLYGNNKKPQPEQLRDIDVLVYDLQDVGVRFYTYISTLQYAMEACADNNKQLIILDRPDPIGFYVDGPVLDTSLRSFVGMQPIPIVYGMTCGEYAQMLAGEEWLDCTNRLSLKVIPCLKYDHKKMYKLRYPPSPNLRTMAAVYLYPSLCLFEGTVVSVGRGTDIPFQQWGHPTFTGKTGYRFTPQAMPGATHPPYENESCWGQLIANDTHTTLQIINNEVHLSWLLEAYQWYPEKDKFFNKFFEKLAGNNALKNQVINGMTEQQIRASWQKDVQKFKKIRKKYLLYPDFE